jgi:hypothetical protein
MFPTIDMPNMPIINGLDGLDYTIGVDVDGNLMPVLIPSYIVVTVPPNKTTYKYGEKIDYTGIVVTAYDAQGNVFEGEDVDDG